MTWTDNLALTMGTLVVWGFLMAFLYNVFMRVISEKDDNAVVWASFVMFISYYSSDLFHDLSAGTEIYLTWFIYDLVTLLLITLPIFLLKGVFNLHTTSTLRYLFIGLTINALLFGAMYVDAHLFKNTEHWVLWSLYSFGVNSVDYAMIITLIVGKDWLGLVRFSRFIKAKLLTKKQALSEKKKCVDSRIKQKRLAHNMIEA